MGTGERFPEPVDTTVGPGAYDLPETLFSEAGAAIFGKTTGERFLVAPGVTAGPGAYEIPEAGVLDAGAATFGKTTGERFVVAPDVTADAGDYEIETALKAAESPKGGSAFGKKTGKRFRRRKPTARSGPGSYKVRKYKAKQAGASFGNSTVGRF